MIIDHFIELNDKMKSFEEGTVEYNDVYIKYLKWYFAYTLISTVGFYVFVYLNVFFLYLITKFAKESKYAETFDPILNKQVPNIVFLQN